MNFSLAVRGSIHALPPAPTETPVLDISDYTEFVSSGLPASAYVHTKSYNFRAACWPMHFTTWGDVYNWTSKEAARLRKDGMTTESAHVLQSMMRWHIEHP